MMVFRLCTAVVFVATFGCDSSTEQEVREVSVASPSGVVRLAVVTDDEGLMTYTVTKNDEVVVETSPMGLLSSTHDLTTGVTMSSDSERAIDESYTMPTGKRRERHVRGSEVTVQLRDSSGAHAELILRAHDDGVAFRYHLLGEGESRVMSESTGFAIPSGARVITRAYDGGDVVFTPTAGEYQQPPIALPLGEAIDRTGFAFPTMFERGSDGLYVVVSEADLGASYCGTRLDEEPQGNLYEIRFPDEREARGVGEVLPESTLPFLTPWRVVMIGDLATVVQSTLVDDLSTPSVLEDESWIRPGRAAWSWFSQDTGTPELQSEYIDFAGEYGWDYVLIDAKWDQWENAEQEVRDLVAQAASAGVEVLLWYNSSGPQKISPLETPLNRMIDSTRRAEMEKISDWGVAGVKVDFFNSDKQDRINQYLGVLRDAADYELLVNFHGSTVPRGWQRTYPHLMTQEAVNGAEVYRLATVQGAPDAITNVRHALLRNIVGSMDYTPVVFEAALAVVGLPYAHSLALAVVFESGIQHFADQADADPDAGYRAVFGAYPYVGDFMSTVPVTWDDTLLVSGGIDDHVIFARRKGTDWYLGGIHAVDGPVEYSFELDFLDPEASYEMTLIGQGENQTSFERSTITVDSGDPMAIALPANSGFVAFLVAQ